MPPLPEQYRMRLAFVDDVISGQAPERRLHYYVLGAGTFRETTVWPPDGTEPSRFALDGDRSLTRDTPTTGMDSYLVDPTATTGKQNRWYQYGAPAYGDRRTEDLKLLTYDSAPLNDDTELVGWPVVTLRMRTTTNDPAVFAYLEDVSPDGRVTYITEGQLRAVNRRVANPGTLPYDAGPAPHSFRRVDAMPVVPDEWFTISLKLYATAALIKKGHRVRLAIAGADQDTFRAMSDGRSERFEIDRGGAEPSAIELPLRPWH
jgi:putative CocE/NonD family hydrolase